MLRSLLFWVLTAAVAAPCSANDPVPAEYQFARPPLEIYDALQGLKLGDVPALPQDERKLLADVWQWRTKKKSAADSQPVEAAVLAAMLWASGVEDAAAREKYRDQFETVVAAAKVAAKDSKDDRDRGERLMKSLHAGVMQKGYSLDQTSFATVLDQGEFNCVSSTAMYLLVGQRLGLKLVPISIPGKPYQSGHAALDLVDGQTRIQVEPTNPDGFDWETKSKQPGVIIIGLVPDRKEGHETDALGIAASIYTNRGVALAKADPPQRLAAIRCNLAALALDPTDPTATNNLLSDFVNLGPALGEEGKHAEAVRALSFGRSLAPQSREIAGNLTGAYARHIEALLAAQKDPEAIALVRQAAEALPEESDFRSAAHWFQRHSSQRRKDAGWEAGLAAIERGLNLLTAEELKELSEARISLYRQWSQELLEKKDVDGSVKVLARAYEIDPKDEDVHDGLGYHTAQALKLLAEQDDAKAIEHFESLVKQFPEVKDVAKVGVSFAARTIGDLADAEKFAEALKAAQRYQPLVVDPQKRAEIEIERAHV